MLWPLHGCLASGYLIKVVQYNLIMTDKEILEEVYRRLQECSSSFRREGHLGVNRYDIKDFIEQEWQKADEEERKSK